jgi:hypothetical protein
MSRAVLQSAELLMRLKMRVQAGARLVRAGTACSAGATLWLLSQGHLKDTRAQGRRAFANLSLDGAPLGRLGYGVHDGSPRAGRSTPPPNAVECGLQGGKNEITCRRCHSKGLVPSGACRASRGRYTVCPVSSGFATGLLELTFQVLKRGRFQLGCGSPQQRDDAPDFGRDGVSCRRGSCGFRGLDELVELRRGQRQGMSPPRDHVEWRRPLTLVFERRYVTVGDAKERSELLL